MSEFETPMVLRTQHFCCVLGRTEPACTEMAWLHCWNQFGSGQDDKGDLKQAGNESITSFYTFIF